MLKNEFYQNIIKINETQNLEELSQIMLNSLKQQEMNINEVVEVIINPNHLSNKNIEKLSDLFEKLFPQHLNWAMLMEMEVFINKSTEYKKKLKDIQTGLFNPILQKAYQSYFIPEIKKDPSQYWSFVKTLIRVNLLKQEELKEVFQLYNLENLKEKQKELLLSINNIVQLKEVAQTLGINPWQPIIIQKDIETWLPIQVAFQNLRSKNQQNNSGLFQIRDFILKEKDNWHGKETLSTSALNFHSKMVSLISCLYIESNLSRALKQLDINNFDLNVINATSETAAPKTLKELLVKQGKIKFAARYETLKNVKDKSDLEQENSLISLLTSNPKKGYQISVKKSFLKSWTLHNQHNINYTSLLEGLLKTAQRKYADSSITLSCYLPIKSEYLNEKIDFWKQIDLTDYYNKDKYFILHNSVSHTSDSFENFIKWIKDKEIDWLKTNEKNENIFNRLITTLLSLERKPQNYNIINKNKDILLAMNKLTTEEQQNTLVNILNTWSTIWNKSHQIDHDSSFNSKHQISSHVFEIVKEILKVAIVNNIETKPIVEHANWKEFVNCLEKYQEYSIACQESLKMVEIMELKNNLLIKPKTTLVRKI